MGLRNRYVKADFWSDAKLFRFTDTQKLLYIGLWAEADDHGWLRWDPEQIAIDLRRGIPLDDGIRDVEAVGQVLASKDRLRLLDCGHAFIPTFLKHQTRVGVSRRTATYLNEHREQCTPSGTERQGAAPSGKERHAARRGGRDSPTARPGREGEGRGGSSISDDDATSAHELEQDVEVTMPDEFLHDHLERVGRPVSEDEAVTNLSNLALNGKSKEVKERAAKTLEKHYKLRVREDGELEAVE